MELREITHDYHVRIMVDRLYSQGKVAMRKKIGRMTVYPPDVKLPYKAQVHVLVKEKEATVKPATASKPIPEPAPKVVEPVVPVKAPEPVPETLPTWVWPESRGSGMRTHKLWVAILRVVEPSPGITAMGVARALPAKYGTVYCAVKDLSIYGLVTDEYDVTGGRHLTITPLGRAAINTPVPMPKRMNKEKPRAPEKPVIVHCRQCPRFTPLTGDAQHGLCRATKRIMKAMDPECSGAREVLQ
jgi:hypothetical protein